MDDPVSLALVRGGQHTALQRQIDIYGSACRLDTKFQRVPPLSAQGVASL